MSMFSAISKAVKDYRGQKRINANYKQLVSDKINYAMLQDMVNGVAERRVEIQVILQDGTRILIKHEEQQQLNRLREKLSSEMDITAALREMEAMSYPGKG